MKIELICKNCENSFNTDFKHRDKLFCNRLCYFEYAKKNNLLGKNKDESVREDRICVQCGIKFNERKKNIRKLCSERCRLLWNKNDENKNKRIDKSKQVIKEKYGVDSIFKTKEFKENYKNIFQSKYGVENPMHHNLFVDNLKKTIQNKTILKLVSKLDEHKISLIDNYVVNKSGNTSMSYNFKCNVCDNIYSSTLLGSGKIPICRKCYPITKNSKLEEYVKDFLNEHNIKHLDNNRKILNGKEIDIYLPDFNMGIEINGNYFHSELAGGKDKSYHLNKTIISFQNNIKLLQIFEDEVILKKDIVFSRLSNFFGKNNVIYARKCEIKEVNKKVSSDFLLQNHIQGESIDKFRYGLFFEDKLVSLMTFGKKRKSLGNSNTNNNSFELVRYCSILNTNVVGGFSKLLNFFIKKHNPHSIETYADIRWSGLNPNDNVYSKNGFQFISQTPPNYWYIKNGDSLNRYHRFSYRKDVLVKEGFSKENSEWEIMKMKGYDRIWDCGSMKYLFLNHNFS